jgi:AcrR family transcriptional regulator
MAEGSFYIYFKDKTDVTVNVLSDLLNNFFNLEAPREGSRSAYDSIRLTNRRWISVCRANAGLMRCILQVGDETPEFARLSQEANRVWYQRVAEGVRRRRGTSPAVPMLAAYLLGGMMDELVRKLIVYPDPDLLALLAGMGANDDIVADASSLIWLRIFYPDEAAPQGLSAPVAALAAWLAP